MIKFFRKIRQNLLMENKTGKYFKYAIGEIILVVIGILIALQINNWNETRKVNDLKQIYYNQLLLDLKADKAYANSMLDKLNPILEAYKIYKETFKGSSQTVQSTYLNAEKAMSPTRNIKFKTNTISSLVNAGDIKILNIELRDKLSKYDGIKNQTETLTTNNNNQTLNILNEIFMLGGAPDLDLRIKNHNKLMKVILPEINQGQILLKIEAYLFKSILITRIAIDRLTNIINEADTLSKIINDEIKK